MMKKTWGLAGVLLATSLSGCATTPTPYQPLVGGQRVSGGYSDIRLSEDRYRVHFAGNSFTSRDRVEGDPRVPCPAVFLITCTHRLSVLDQCNRAADGVQVVDARI